MVIFPFSIVMVNTAGFLLVVRGEKGVTGASRSFQGVQVQIRLFDALVVRWCVPVASGQQTAQSIRVGERHLGGRRRLHAGLGETGKALVGKPATEVGV